MDKIRIKLKRKDPVTSDVVKITPEAQIALRALVVKYGLSAREIVSQLILQGGPYIEIVE